jgi:uncharacterized protein (TIGR03435 family)
MPARASLVGLLLLGWPATALMQDPALPAFEVAAISPAGPLDPQAILSGKLRLGLTATESRVEIGLMSLADLLPRAFRVQPYQISGPPWLGDQRFDIRATIPSGASKEQVPEMLQSLLAARFGLVTHRESREMPVYALIVGKEGPRLGEALAPAPPADPAPGEITLGAGTNQVRITPGAPGTGGMTMVASSEETGTVGMSLDPAKGIMRMDLRQITMRALADMLTPLAGRPVVDRTGLTGPYRAALDLSISDMLHTAGAHLGGLLPPGAAATVGGAPAPAAAASDPSGTSIVQAVRGMGLDLDSRRMPVEVIVVDRIEREPTPN